MVSGRRKIAVVQSHPIQYFAPLYAYLNRDERLEVTVFYCSDFSLRGGLDIGFGREVTWDVDLLTGYRAVFLGRRARKRIPRGFWSLICPEIWQAIRRGGFDAVWIHGYAHAVSIVAFAAAKLAGVPVLMRSETHLGLHRSTLRRRLRDGALRWGYRAVDAFLAIGTANRTYYRSLGVPEKRIFDVPYAVDSERFIRGSTDVERHVGEVRAALGLRSDVPVVLFASKLMRRKRPDDVLRAVAALARKGVRAQLLIAGTGAMEEELRSHAQALGFRDVVFAGFVNQAELPRILGASDIFVLPSEDEPWGLVVNEAMSAGLPVIVSSEVGCAADLVHGRGTGYVVPPGNVPALAAALEHLISDSLLRRRMAAAARKRIGEWTYEQCRIGLIQALDSLADPARSRPS